jgi:hypothetical protein
LNYGFQKKVCTSKAPTFFSRQPLFSIARVRFPNSNLHLNFMVHFIKKHFMFCGVNYSKKCSYNNLTTTNLNQPLQLKAKMFHSFIHSLIQFIAKQRKSPVGKPLCDNHNGRPLQAKA